MKRTYCVAVFLVSACFFGLVIQRGAAAEITKPNIIVIMADDVGFGDMGIYGAKGMKTPNLDKLATDGLRFASGYCNAATCTPTRFSFLTGIHAFRQKGTGVAPPNAPAIIQPGTPTTASVLKQAGYKTAVIGKWHLGLGNPPKPNWNGILSPGPLEIGFDYCFIYPTTNDRVPSVYIENHRVLNLDPNDPLDTPETARPNEPNGVTHRDTLRMDWSHGHNQTVHNGIGRIGWAYGGKSAMWRDEDMADDLVAKSVTWIKNNKNNPFFLFYTPQNTHVPRMPNERFQGKTDLGPRGDSIAELDWCIGELMKTLKEENLLENTMVVFCSDNGPVLDDGYKDDAVEKLGDHTPSGKFKGGKYSPYEGGTRIPFFVQWTGTIQPGDSQEIFCTLDFPATLAALVGQQLPAGTFPDSFNLKGALLGEKGASGRPFMLNEAQNRFGYRVGDWKLVTPPRRPNTPNGAFDFDREKCELYDLAADIGETNNVSSANTAQRDVLLNSLLKVMNPN